MEKFLVNEVCMISVVIATFNGGKYIKEQISSILLQLGQNDEIIISDDKSSDNTIETIKSFCDPRITIVNGEGQGVVKNFENALIHSKGDLIFLCDQDDVWENNKISIILEQLKNASLVVHNANFYDESLNRLENDYFSFRKSKEGTFKNIYKNSFVGCCMAFDKKVLEKALPFPKNLPMHDQWIGLIAQKYFKVCFIPDCLIKHRRHSSNTSNTQNSGFVNMVKFRLNIILNLLRR